MKICDFHIGLEFSNSTGRFRCTDVGTRTITAIALDRDDERWYVGPPYMVPEHHFDERDIKKMFVTTGDAIVQSMESMEKTGLTYPSQALRRMMKERSSPAMLEYPNRALLRYDKLIDGEIHHPYAARLVDGEWRVLSYLSYVDQFVEVEQHAFRDHPMAGAEDYVFSKNKHQK